MFYLTVNFMLRSVRYGLCNPNLAGKRAAAEGKANLTQLISLTSLLNYDTMSSLCETKVALCMVIDRSVLLPIEI